MKYSFCALVYYIKAWTKSIQKFICYVPGEKIKTPADIIGIDIPSEDTIYKAIRTGKAEKVIGGMGSIIIRA